MLDSEAERVYLYSMNLNERFMTAGVLMLLVLAFTVEAVFGPWWQKVLWFGATWFVVSLIFSMWLGDIINEQKGRK